MLGGVLELTLEESGEIAQDDREFEWLAPSALEVRLASRKDAVDPDPEDEPVDEVEDDDEDLDDEDYEDDEDDEGRELDDDLIDLDDEWDEKDTDDDDKHDSPRRFYE